MAGSRPLIAVSAVGRYARQDVTSVVGFDRLGRAASDCERWRDCVVFRRLEVERLLELIRELHRRNYFAYGS